MIWRTAIQKTSEVGSVMGEYRKNSGRLLPAPGVE